MDQKNPFIPWCFVLSFLALLASALDSHVLRHKRSDVSCSDYDMEAPVEPQVFLTVNSKDRRVELNWIGPRDGPEENDWVGLFKSRPNETAAKRDEGVKFGVNVSMHSSRAGGDGFPGGYFKTATTFPNNPLQSLRSGLNTTNRLCIRGMWIGYIRDSRVIATNCFELNPSWMWKDRDVIGDIPLRKLMIPGTHNSGSYITTNIKEPSVFKSMSQVQDEDIWHQLVYGVRYLDLRVSIDTFTPEKYWIVHDFVSMNPLYKVIQDVKKFIRDTNEIVIMDFHRFPSGFDNDEDGTAMEKHAALIGYLQEELGNHTVPDWVGSNIKPNDIWNLEGQRRLLITYSHEPSADFNTVLWPEVIHAWGNSKNPTHLKNYLTDEMVSRSGGRSYFWAAMTHLTPSPLDFLFNAQNFRSLNNQIARKVSRWYRRRWWSRSNIVATDFFLSNNLIQISINANRKRAACNLG